MAKADEKGAGSFPHRMGRGRLFRCGRFCLERSEVGEGLTGQLLLACIVKTRLVAIERDICPNPYKSSEVGNDQFLEANPSRKYNEESKHAEKYNCRGFVGPFGKGLQMGL